MNQRLISSRFPNLPIQIQLGQQVREVEALFDTGFEGAVAVPSDFVVGRAPDFYLQWKLADDSTVSAPSYRALVRLGDFGPFPSLISVLGDEYLIGRALTDRFTVVLDHGQRIMLEP